MKRFNDYKEFIEWCKKTTTATYTEIPQEYYDTYEDWFKLNTIKNKFNGNLFNACRAHPVYFAYYLLGIKLRVYQVFAIDQMVKKRFIYMLWGRRLGKSTIFKIFALWSAFNNVFPVGLTQTTKNLIIAHTVDSVEDYITEIDAFLEQGDRRVEQLFNGKLGSKYFTSKKPKKGKSKAKDTSQKTSLFNNGWNTIEVYPPTPKARGKGGSVMFLDELASWKDYTTDEYKIYNDVIRPIITDNTYTKIFCATTPDGKSGLAYDLFPVDGHKTVYEAIWFPFWIRDDENYLKSMYETFLEYQAQGREQSFRQEFMAEFISASSTYFSVENEVEKVFDDRLEMYPTYVGECEVGIDFGGSKTSHTVITVSTLNEEGKIQRLWHHRYPVGEDMTLQQDIIDLYHRFPNITKFHIDSQGGGSSFYSWFTNTFGSGMIDLVVFRKEKVDLYKQFKIACFQNRVKSYYDPDLYKEMVEFRIDLKPPTNGTDDMLDSFMLSCKDWLVKKDTGEYFVIKY